MRIHLISSLLLAAGIMFLPASSAAQFRATITIAPPELLTYEQPICPGDGYLWTPGYWAWDDAYYWVPGAWVMAPEPGYLWTPGYWGWSGDSYIFNEGYWGTSVGFYGGIDYGFGYFGLGYEGGRWDNGRFFYNRSVNRLNVSVIHNTYNTRVNMSSVSHVSYNGGNGGTTARATTQEEAAARSRHIAPVAAQAEHAQAAHNNPQRPSANRSAPRAAVHPNELPAVEHPARPNTGNAKLDQQYQKQQDQLAAKQNQDRQKLQQTQDKEHQQLAKQGATAARTQQLEQRHQAQTQQMQQGHAQQTQRMQQRQQPAGGRGGRK